MTNRTRIPIGDLVAELCDRMRMDPTDVTEIVITPDRVKMSVFPDGQPSPSRARPFWPVSTVASPKCLPDIPVPGEVADDVSISVGVPRPSLDPLEVAAWTARADRHDR